MSTAMGKGRVSNYHELNPPFIKLHLGMKYPGFFLLEKY